MDNKGKSSSDLLKELIEDADIISGNLSPIETITGIVTCDLETDDTTYHLQNNIII